MKELLVLNLQDIENRALQSRINLANRPRLQVDGGRLNELARNLSTKSADRTRFVSNPAAYLKEHSINVSSCRLVEGVVTQPTEVCTGPVLACVVAVVVLAVAVAVAVLEVKVTSVVPVSDGESSAASPALLNGQVSPFSFGSAVV